MHPTQPLEIFSNVFTLFYTPASHPLISVQNFTEIVPGKLLRRWLNARGVAKYSDVGHVDGYFGNGARYGLGLVGGFGLQFGETVYIFELDGAKKVKSDAQVAMNKISDPVQKFFYLLVAGEDSASHSKFFQTSGIARKLIFGLHVNIDKANRGVYDVTR